MLAAIILAAGESRRMGQPKALLPFPQSSPPKTSDTEPKTFLEHLLEVTRHPRVGMVRVVVGAHAKEIRARVALPGDCVVVNLEWEKGQLSSLQAAIRSLPAREAEKLEGIIVCLVDHPLISSKTIGALIEAFDSGKNKIIIPTFRGRRGHPVIFPATFFAGLLAAPEEIGARAVVRGHPEAIFEVGVEEEGILLNLNDPETFRRASNNSAGQKTEEK